MAVVSFNDDKKPLGERPGRREGNCKVFNPANSEHSVTIAAFAIELAGEIPPEVVQAAASQPDLWPDVPARQEIKGAQFVVGEDGGQARNVDGISFGFLRPDGSPAWVVRALGNEIASECRRYTRWNNVAPAAIKHLNAFLLLLDQHGASPAISNIRLVMIDEFFAQEAQKYDLPSLLQPSTLLPETFFDRGQNWHLYQGWFEEVEGNSLLVNLNIDGRLPMNHAPTPSVGITNTIDYRPITPMTAASILSNEVSLDTLFEQFHLINKRIIAELLAEEMKKRINLHENSNS